MENDFEDLPVQNQQAIDIAVLPNRSTFPGLAYTEGSMKCRQIILFTNETGTWAVYMTQPKNNLYNRIVFIQSEEMVVYFSLNNKTHEIDPKYHRWRSY